MKKSNLFIRLLFPALAFCLAFATVGDAAEYKYDPLNRLTEVVYDNGQKLVYTYDAAGNLLSVQLVSPPGLPVPPILNPIGNRTAIEGQELRFTLTAYDGNGDALSFLAENLPRGATLDRNTGLFAWTPDYTQAGTYNVRFIVSDGTLSDGERVVLTVLDNLPPLHVSIADITVTEGDEGVAAAAFTVSLSNPSPWDVTVDYATADGTAQAGGDYIAQSGRLFFPAGEAAPREILVSIIGDPFAEEDESFTVNLTAVRNAVAVKAQAVCVIADDDEGSLTVRPVDAGTGASPVGVTFTDVTEAGQTTLAISESGPPPPVGFRIGEPPLYYEISTTAVCSGPITVAIDYSGIAFINEAAIRLFHHENGAWVDRTVRLDRTNKVIYAVVSSLSPFAIFEPDPALPAPAAITWERVYGGEGQEILHALRETGDGGCILAGETIPAGADAGDIWLLRLDLLGNIVWQKAYGGSGADAAYAVDLAADGGYILAGSTRPAAGGEADLLVMRVDAEGETVWRWAFGGAGFDAAAALKATADGGCVVAGSTASFGRGGLDAWVLKLGPDGEVRWQMTYGGSLDDKAAAILAKDDGGFVLAGETASFGAGDIDGWLLELDALGNVVRQRTYGGPAIDRFTALQPLAGGGFALAGATTSGGSGGADLLLLELSATGEIVRQRTYGTAADEEASAVHALADEGLLVAGRAAVLAGGTAIRTPVLVKLDSEWGIAWQRQYWQPIEETGPAAALPADGGFLLGGATRRAGQADFLAVKTDADGRVGACCGLDAGAGLAAGAITLQAMDISGTGMASAALAGCPDFQVYTTGEAAGVPCGCGEPFALYILDPQAGLYAYGIDAVAGSLTPMDGSPFAAGDGPAAAVAIGGRYLYVANSGSDDVSAFALDAANGVPSSLGAPFKAGRRPAGIAAHPSGRFVYVINSDSNDITAYRIEAGGVLAEIPGSPWATGSRPLAIALDPLGRYAYVANGGENTLSVHAIDRASGRLAPLAGSPLPTGSLPSAVAVDPSGRFVFVANSISDDICVFAVNAATGALSEIQGSPFAAGAGPETLAIDPLGRYVYVLDGWSREIRGFAIDAATGALSAVAETGYPVPSGGGSLALDPSGRFLYATSPYAGRVTAYAIDQGSGSLLEIAGPPAAAGLTPRGAAAAHRPIPAISVADATGSEGEPVTIEVSLSHPCDHYVTVGYATYDATAAAGADYQPSRGRLIFAPGETAIRVAIALLADTVAEAEESFLFCLEDPTRAVVGDGQAAVIVIDAGGGADNHPPQMQPIEDKTVKEGELLQFKVTATDPDGDKLTYTAHNLPVGAGFDPETRTFSWTPGYDQAGIYRDIRFTASDGKASDTETITIVVSNTSPIELFVELGIYVEKLKISRGAKNSLLLDLADALIYWLTRQTYKATEQMLFFIQKVEALQGGKQISPSQAEFMIGKTREIIEAIR